MTMSSSGKSSQITLITSLGALAIIVLAVAWNYPLLNSIQSTRKQIDTTRALIESVRQQQLNVEQATQTFSNITEADDAAASVFLNENRAIQFFNAVDDLADASGLRDLTKRLDSPSAADYQTIGLHLTFTASYPQALDFINQLPSLRPIVVPQSIIASQSGAGSQTYQLDGLVAWEQ